MKLPRISLTFADSGVYYSFAAGDGAHWLTGDLSRYAKRPPSREDVKAAAQRALANAIDHATRGVPAPLRRAAS